MSDAVKLFGLDRETFTWQDMNMCQGLPIRVFFDESESNPNVLNAVKEICGYCPVKSYCLEYGRESKSYGVFGGERLSGGKIVK